jgi:hypothetical protein
MTLIQFCTSAYSFNQCSHFEKSWFVAGSIGQKVSSTVYGRTVDKDTGRKQMHLAFYSCELELNFSAIKGNLNGINPEIRVQQLWKRFTCDIHGTKGRSSIV